MRLHPDLAEVALCDALTDRETYADSRVALLRVESTEDFEHPLVGLKNIPWVSKRREPVVLLIEFGSSSVDYEASVWIEDPWKSRNRLSDLREAIWWDFKEASITIAFPQLDVHFDPPVVESFRDRAIA